MNLQDNSVIASAVVGANNFLQMAGLPPYDALWNLLQNIISSSNANCGDGLANAINDAANVIDVDAESIEFSRLQLEAIIKDDRDQFGEDSPLKEWATAVSRNSSSTVHSDAVEYLRLSMLASALSTS